MSLFVLSSLIGAGDSLTEAPKGPLWVKVGSLTEPLSWAFEDSERWEGWFRQVTPELKVDRERQYRSHRLWSGPSWS